MNTTDRTITIITNNNVNINVEKRIIKKLQQLMV